MQASIWQTIANTPWWIFAFWGYLFYIGLLATKPRIITMQRLLILPIILLSTSISFMILTKSITLPNIGYGFLGLLLGTCIGWLQFRWLKIKAIPNETKVYIPGTWNLLVFMIGMLALKYYFGIQSFIDPNITQQPYFMTGLSTLYGVFTGLLLGRLIWVLRCIKKGPYFTPAH